METKVRSLVLQVDETPFIYLLGGKPPWIWRPGKEGVISLPCHCVLTHAVLDRRKQKNSFVGLTI